MITTQHAITLLSNGQTLPAGIPLEIVSNDAQFHRTMPVMHIDSLLAAMDTFGDNSQLVLGMRRLSGETVARLQVYLPPQTFMEHFLGTGRGSSTDIQRRETAWAGMGNNLTNTANLAGALAGAAVGTQPLGPEVDGVGAIVLAAISGLAVLIYAPLWLPLYAISATLLLVKTPVAAGT